MGWSDVKPTPPPPPGVWEKHWYGTDYSTWTLRLGPVFMAQITNGGGRYYTTVNGEPLPVVGHLQDAQWQAERAIIAHVRAMLPGYKVMLNRAKMMTGPIGAKSPKAE